LFPFSNTKVNEKKESKKGEVKKTLPPFLMVILALSCGDFLQGVPESCTARQVLISKSFHGSVAKSVSGGWKQNMYIEC
jgi:hypothetical protein